MANQIDSKTKICGLLGYPIGHSISPLIHNELAARYGQNLVYVPLQVAPEKLKDAIAGADAWEFLGMNVTIPYKQDVIPYLTQIDPVAKQIGACNTLVRIEGGYKGYNTDAPGLYRAMEEAGAPIEGADAVVLGAGGVAKAIVYMLAEHGVRRIFILNRTQEKAQALAEELNAYYRKAFAYGMEMAAYRKLPEKDLLVIQATNIGMTPNTDAVVIEDPDFYSRIGFAVDVIFNPMETKFMALAKAAGAGVMNGLKMLLYQGIIAYELWNHVEVSAKDAQEIYALMLQKLQG